MSRLFGVPMNFSLSKLRWSTVFRIAYCTDFGKGSVERCFNSWRKDIATGSCSECSLFCGSSINCIRQRPTSRRLQGKASSPLPLCGSKKQTLHKMHASQSFFFFGWNHCIAHSWFVWTTNVRSLWHWWCLGLKKWVVVASCNWQAFWKHGIGKMKWSTISVITI